MRRATYKRIRRINKQENLYNRGAKSLLRIREYSLWKGFEARAFSNDASYLLPLTHPRGENFLFLTAKHQSFKAQAGRDDVIHDETLSSATASQISALIHRWKKVLKEGNRLIRAVPFEA